MKTSCIVSPAKDPFVIVRKSWIEICDGNHCAAMLLNFFVSWHDWKIEHQSRAERENDVAQRHGDNPTQNTSLLQHHTVAELKDGLLGLFAEKTISKGITKLLDLGFITQSRNPNPRYKFDQTYHYQVFPSVIQDAIDALSKDTESIPHNGIMQSAKKLYDSAITPNHTAKVPDESSFLANHYQDPFQNTNQDTSQNTNPERARAAAPVLKTEDLEPEPEQSEPLASTEPIPDLLEQHSISRVGESSAACSTNLHGATKQFNDSWNYSSDIAPLTDELIRLYNNGKPDNWTGIVGDSRRARRKIQDMALKYQGMGGKLAEIPEMMKNALLFYRSSDFHTKKEFGSGDIFWLCEQERVEIAAAKWEGMGEASKRKVAIGILEKENGIPDWRTGKTMDKYAVGALPKVIRKMYIHNTIDKPSREWIEKWAPEILENLISEGLIENVYN
jgi:hypothetical protein